MLGVGSAPTNWRVLKFSSLSWPGPRLHSGARGGVTQKLSELSIEARLHDKFMVRFPLAAHVMKHVEAALDARQQLLDDDCMLVCSEEGNSARVGRFSRCSWGFGLERIPVKRRTRTVGALR
jgi:hypothetical protein